MNQFIQYIESIELTETQLDELIALAERLLENQQDEIAAEDCDELSYL